MLSVWLAWRYYHYWERRIFNAITSMLLRGMSTFQTLFSAGERKRPPLLRVKADCSGSEIDDQALQSAARLLSGDRMVPRGGFYFIRLQ